MDMDTNYKDTKECPMCAETVKEKAKICRFCTHEFKFETEEINRKTQVIVTNNSSEAR